MPTTPAATPVESSLTAYVADFVVSTRPQDIPPDVAHLGRRSVLDGLGLALAGSVSETGRIAQRYLAALGIASASGSVVIGTGTAAARAFCRVRQWSRDTRRRLRRHAARGRYRPCLRAPHASDRAGVAARAGNRGARPSQRPGHDDRLSDRRRSRMQDRRSHPAPPLPARLPQHGDLRGDRGCRGSREPSPAGSRDHPPCARHRREPGGRAARELRHDDQAVSCGPRRGERAHRRRNRGARLHRVADRARSRPRLLPCGRRRLQRRRDRRQARRAVDVRVPRRVDQAAPERLAHAPRHERDAGPHSPPRSARRSACGGSPWAPITTCPTRSSTIGRRTSSRPSSAWNSAWRSCCSSARPGSSSSRTAS